MDSLSRVCGSAADTQRLARVVGAAVRGPLLIFLEGDLGSGKTCFAQGLARGLGVPEDVPVTSPSFTLVNAYSGRLPFIHVDLYRLGAGDLDDIGMDELLETPAVLAIEWAERMPPPAGLDRLEVRLETVDDAIRRITLRSYGRDSRNLIKEVDLLLKEASWP